MRRIFKISWPNGWTVSIAPDTNPGCWNIIAWPTRQDNMPWECIRMYAWDGDENQQLDCQLWSIADLLDRLAEISTADPPPP